ncbi:MAG: SIS domain-containing protein, partial [Actinomycetes bacterium]
ESVLDDADALAARDPGEMLRAVATAGAQIREGLLRLDGDAVGQVVADGRPRALLVTGMGGSGIAGDVVGAVTGTYCPVPVLVSRGHRLPGWVGPMDLVVAVSASGETEETIAATDEALRRGARVVTVGKAGAALAQRAGPGRAVHLAVDTGGRMPRASLWSLATPVLVLVDGLGLAEVPRGLLDGVADQLDALSEACGPASEAYDNVAKKTALALSGTLPHIWGASAVAAVAAQRFSCQLAENAKQPSVHGPLTEVLHNQVVSLAGRYGAGDGDIAEDIFRDPLLDGAPTQERMRLLLLRDTDELEQVAARCAAMGPLAGSYGVVVDELAATGEHPLERLASLIAPLDFASVYLALLEGTDPTPIEPIVTLKKASG